MQIFLAVFIPLLRLIPQAQTILILLSCATWLCQGYSRCLCEKHRSHLVDSILWNHAVYTSFCGSAFALHSELRWLGCGPGKEKRQREALLYHNFEFGNNDLCNCQDCRFCFHGLSDRCGWSREQEDYSFSSKNKGISWWESRESRYLSKIFLLKFC